jgi:hypothetical protein
VTEKRKRKPQQGAHFHLVLPERLYKWFKRIARRDRMPISMLMRQALEEFQDCEMRLESWEDEER